MDDDHRLSGVILLFLIVYSCKILNASMIVVYTDLMHIMFHYMHFRPAGPSKHLVVHDFFYLIFDIIPVTDLRGSNVASFLIGHSSCFSRYMADLIFSLLFIYLFIIYFIITFLPRVAQSAIIFAAFSLGPCSLSFWWGWGRDNTRALA